MTIKKKKNIYPKNILKLIKEKSKGSTGLIRLDVACGDGKQDDTWVGMDIRPCKGVDIVHNVEEIPYPLPSNCCQVILAAHIIEHLKPWLIIDIINEWWRLLDIGGQLWIALPYAGSFGYFQDPTHLKTWNEATANYFSAKDYLYEVYKPKPFKIVRNDWQLNGNLEVVMEKLSEEEGKKIYEAMKEIRKAEGVTYGKN